MGVKCLWHWTVPSTSSYNREVALIHDHLIHNLHAKPVDPLPLSGLSEFTFSNPVNYTPLSTTSWFRVCQFLHHVEPTITGTGGGVSSKITDQFLRGRLNLSELPDQPPNPRYEVTNKTRIATNMCFKVALSDAEGKIYFITPACPNGKESVVNDRKIDPLHVSSITQKITSTETMTDPLVNAELIPTSRTAQPTPARNAELKAALLPAPGFLSAVDAVLQRDVLECDVALVPLLDRLARLRVSTTCVVAGQAFRWRDFIVRTGLVTVDGRTLDTDVWLEIEYMGCKDNCADPLLFAVAFAMCVPQHPQLHFQECNSSFSPCLDHDLRDVNPPAALLASTTRQQLVETASVVDPSGAGAGYVGAGQSVGHRVSAAHLAACAMYGLEEEPYGPKHTALQYIQLLLHVQNK